MSKGKSERKESMPCLGGCTLGCRGRRAVVWVEDSWPRRLQRGEEFSVDSFNDQAKKTGSFPEPGTRGSLEPRNKTVETCFGSAENGEDGQPPPPAQSAVGTSSTKFKLPGSPHLGRATPSNALGFLGLMSVQSECPKILKRSDYFLFPRAQLL